ncbi:hypothetical protein B9Z55_025141 [Caenorhabditis nigoni]|uniref:Serine/threonine specific protein phosphatases domain-containing protein n=1 Tax=Caenorhabditis nigoni TaxID=1611254 RepID=A0A2G5SXT9_9PELO|nr:hypothetical protein B9Z55_025141 [Caenorhabditis nigoni]
MSEFFQAKCSSKYDSHVTRLFIKLFCYLPIVACNDNFLYLHGGLAGGLETFEDFEKFERRYPIVNPRVSPIFDSVWSDPCSVIGNATSFGQNERDGGITTFNDNVSNEFCLRNEVRIIRGHQVYVDGVNVRPTKLLACISSMNFYGKDPINGKVVECDRVKANIRDVVHHPISFVMCYFFQLSFLLLFWFIFLMNASIFFCNYYNAIKTHLDICNPTEDDEKLYDRGRIEVAN